MRRSTMWLGLAVVGVVGCLAAAGSAAVRTETVEYRQGQTVLEGYLAYDDAVEGKRPGVLVIHEWWGLNDYARMRARQLAEMGYVALAADVYGKGRRAKTAAQAGKLAGQFKSDRPLLRRRVQAGLAQLKAHKLVDPGRVAAIGFCFGGTAALELARSGADLQAVVSFHGGLATPNPRDAKRIKAKVLVLHGGADPHVPPAEVAAFQKEMRDAGVDWQMNTYGRAVHSFTNHAAGSNTSRGAAYDKQAAERSWAAMKLFFVETIGPGKRPPDPGGRPRKPH